MFSKILNQRKPGDYPKGLSQKTIEKVSIYCKEHFDCPLPTGYSAFLEKANGFSYNGYSVFCCYNDEIENVFPRYAVLDLVTFNTKFYANTDITSYFMPGKSSIEYLGFDKSTEKYVIMTNGIIRHIKESEDFNEILEAFFYVS